MVTNPLIADDDKGRVILNDMLVAYKKHLPQFESVINKLEKINKGEF